VDREAPAEVDEPMMQKAAALDPKETLLKGAEILATVLVPAGFVFNFREHGRGSGGQFAWGEFVRDDRRLEFHFRFSLGMVTYHVGSARLGHEEYMKRLGVYERRHYPDFPEHPLDSFTELSRDLVEFCSDFTLGDASRFLSCASRKE
jgi:hypothetical protein